MIFSSTYKIGMEDIGLNYEATNKALLSFMEDVACLHSATAGFGVLDVETKHRAWILLDWKLEVIRRPRYNEEIEVSTWATDFDKLCALRDFDIKDENGNIIALGSSRWILTDTERRRPIRLTDEIIEPYEPEERHVFEKALEDPVISQEDIKDAHSMEYKVLRRDIDINKHMHNINYLELAMEALPEDVYENVIFDSVRIKYKQEIKPEETIKVSYFRKDKLHMIIMSVEDKINAVIELCEKAV